MNPAAYLYLPGDGWAQRADPRVKLLLVAAVWTVLFANHSLEVLLGILFLLHLLYAAARLPRGRVLSIWKTFLPLGLLITTLWAIFHPDRVLLWPGSWLRLSPEGFVLGLMLALRLAAMAFVLFFWLYTTDPGRMILGLVRLKMPYEWGLIITLALNYIPAFQILYRTILEAQQARGLRLEGGVFRRVRLLMPVFVPLVISILRLSDQLAKALEARAFGASGVQRTYLAEIHFRASDYLITAIILAATLILLAVRFL